ncbi:TlpA disulfide reductase family protein [Polaromonas sp.]|uniref:TlpA family protein disulfide reductase n=1 Tax=Polaromonas sp. TaxID=1869339 RepID=UPI00184EE0A4|nr:TlpA disulfide reductase family protein [Polaromonas sp.]NMM05009.1 TlpA family protein disulfide reductase [Polaromonas sp.]
MAVLLMSVAGCKRPESVAPQLVEGQAFPSFMLNYVLGENANTPAFQGKVLVLNVWATWCPPCRKEMPSLQRLSQTLDPKRFSVIGLSTDRDALLATEFLAQGGVTFSNFFDPNGKMSKQLGLRVYPETFLIAPDGTLVRRVTGLQDWSSPEMLALLEDIYRTERGSNVRN